MRRAIIALAASAALAIPAISIAADQPSQQNKDNAAKFCKALRDAAGKDNFRSMFGTNKDKSNAYGKCVSQHAKQNKQKLDQQETQSATNAAKDCRAEKNQDPAAFKQKYGTNKNKSNAFGKCVSQKEHQQNSGGGGGTP